ncbi:hypothetical protein GOODEAATRI_023852 [Goodea atripinnis]|uniref:Uncharacterized protein n=1 Tax=Goodea atripinnis TaxID=208336 RepID=A0ABV0PGJ6_9TELE
MNSIQLTWIKFMPAQWGSWYPCFLETTRSWVQSFCMKFACSPHACVVFLGTPAYSNSPQTVRFTGLSEFTSDMSVCIHGCLSFVSVLPSDGLASCPGCTTTFTQLLLEIGTTNCRNV